ncbi:sigma-70 family RNA polymerase sigma factor [Nocardia sp. XZ_19_369]|uniref:sigma-70 family RNA polymerase sigma factor n=1 Tax=Nocardia sp. XZ_19_369 TaxID=2769487 RepID=UPI00188E0AF7|nr:sigma-70 family RNA polymerase sigma factor [Nocardia sp. XZ_19_369]
MTTRPQPMVDEIVAIQRSELLVDPDDERAAPDQYPSMRHLSAAHICKAVIRAEVPEPQEYVTLPMWSRRPDRIEFQLAVAKWNTFWEAAQFRRRFFGEDLPPELLKIAEKGDINVVLLPRTRSRYYEYSPLFHLLSRSTLERYRLPLLHRGQWPFSIAGFDPDPYLPTDFCDKLSRAWSSAVWRDLMPGSPSSGFTKSDPIRLLSHNLDFWLPPVTEVIQQELRQWNTIDNGGSEGPVSLDDGSFLEGATAAHPRAGGSLWWGEDEAACFVSRTVEQADPDGRLRGILDAVRSNRVEDDFSDRWTFEREDFERKLYRKRSKIKVRFVELTDTIPVQGPETETIDRVVYSDFLALLNERDREVVVLLHSGVTSLTEIADIMGYSNHSPISKRLNRIRKQAAHFFGDH